MSRGVKLDLIVRQGAVLTLTARLWARQPSTVIDPVTFQMTEDPGETIDYSGLGFRAMFRAGTAKTGKRELSLTHEHFRVVGEPGQQTIVGRGPASLTALMTAEAGEYDWEAYDLADPDEVLELQYGTYKLGYEATKEAP